MKKGILLLLLIVLSSLIIKAVPSFPGMIEFIQPDGKKVNIYLKGDERLKWAETTDGYTIIFNKEGFYEYGELDEVGDLVNSGIIARNIQDRTDDEIKFLSTLKRYLFFSKEQISMLKQIWDIYDQENKNAKAFPTTGDRSLICILIGFTDLAFTKTQADFNNLFNQVGYSYDNASGSVKDYFLENSYNLFNLTVDVAGPYTASNTMAYYGQNTGGQGTDIRPRTLVSEAITLANPDVNYANYDNDNDGSVDGVYVIYAGYGEEAGGSTNAIWAHAWTLLTPLNYDGKSISRYSCSAELRGNSGTGITRIGVICHEFGHVLGAPDFYDTDYATGGQFEGTGNWDMQAGGSWNNGGITPPHSNPYTKCYLYGWATPTVISATQTITLLNSTQNSNQFYRYNTTTSGEYFLIENRQKIGFDIAVPGHGMLIYHVHSTIGTTNINTTHPQKMYPVCASATTNPSSTPADYGNINSAGCPFPGSSLKTAFTDATIPWSRSWAGANTNKPVTNIIENPTDKTVTFCFMGCGTSNDPQNFTATAVSSSQINLAWNLNGSGNPVVIATNSTMTFGVPVNGSTYSVGNTIPGGGTVIYVGSATGFNHTSLNPSTGYYYKAWSQMAGNTYSPGVNAYAKTLCGTITTYPWVETFSYNGDWPDCWTQTISGTGATERWSASSTNVSGGASPEMKCTYQNINPATTRLISPVLNTVGATSLTLSFKQRLYDYGAGATLRVKTSNDKVTWTNSTWSYTTGSGSYGPITTNITITGNLNSPTTYICWEATGNLYQFDYWFIDDINVSAVFPCTPPTIQASNFSATPSYTSINVGWTGGNGDEVLVVARQGSAVNQDPTMGTSYTANATFSLGSQIGTGNWVVYKGAANSVNVTGLTEGTSYHFAIYEYNTAGNCYMLNELTGNATTLVTPPNITGATPDNFFADKGKQIVLSGTYLGNVTLVTLGGVTGTIDAQTSTSLTVTFQAGNYTNNTLTASNSGGDDTYTVTVNKRNTIPVGGGTDFHTTIQSALNGLSAWYGTTSFDAGQLPGTKYIDVYNGAYTEAVIPNVSLNPSATNRLVIQNSANQSPVVNATGLANGFYIGALNYVTVTGFSVYGANSDNIYTEGDNNVISYNKSYSSVGGSGIRLSAANNSTVDHNLVYSNYNYGVHLMSNTTSVVENNTLYDNGHANLPSQNVQLFTEGWESGISTGWTITGNTARIWTRTTGDAGNAHSGTSYLYFTPSANASQNSSATFSNTPQINIGGYTNFEISCWVKSVGIDATSYDQLVVEYQIDGGGWNSAFASITTNQASYTQYISSIIATTGSLLELRFIGYANRTSETWYLDDILVIGDEINGDNQGSCLYVQSGTGTTVENNILYAKTGSTSFYALNTGGNTVTSTYNNYYGTNPPIYNGTSAVTLAAWAGAGVGDISTDPLFVNAPTDFHLRSTAGSYNGGIWPPTILSGGTWTNHATDDSPSIDAGNPGDLYGNEPEDNGDQINQGAYGNTVQASKSGVVVVPLTWDGSSSNDWFTAANWTPEMVPTGTDNVIIAAVATLPLINDGIDNIAVCNDLTINASASLTIATNGYMTVNGVITNNTGNAGLVINSDATGTGSLIHNSGSGVLATVQSYNAGSQWHMFSSPINNAAFTVLPTTANTYYYDESTADYWTGVSYGGTSVTGWTAVPASMMNAKGYIHYFNSNATLSYTGTLNPNTTTSAILVPYTDNGDTEPNTLASWNDFDGWNLIGNPYTSAIDWDDLSVLHLAANLMDAVYTYDDESLHNYTTYAGGVSLNGGSRYIPAGQGFFVKGNNAGGTLNIGANARAHNTQTYWKGNKETPVNFMRLEVSGNGFKDETVVRMLPDATNAMDNGMDAYKFFTWHESVPQIYTRTEGSADYSINTIPELEEGTISIPLRLLQTGDSYTIKVSEFNFEGVKVYLKDNALSKTTEIGLDDVIELTTDASDAEGRFELVFEKSGSSIVSDVNHVDVMIYPNPNEGTFNIRLENYSSGYELEISNVIGQLVYKNLFEDANVKEIKIDGANAGVYFLKIRLEDGSVVNRKIIINY